MTSRDYEHAADAIADMFRTRKRINLEQCASIFIHIFRMDSKRFDAAKFRQRIALMLSAYNTNMVKEKPVVASTSPKETQP